MTIVPYFFGIIHLFLTSAIYNVLIFIFSSTEIIRFTPKGAFLLDIGSFTIAAVLVSFLLRRFISKRGYLVRILVAAVFIKLFLIIIQDYVSHMTIGVPLEGVATLILYVIATCGVAAWLRATSKQD